MSLKVAVSFFGPSTDDLAMETLTRVKFTAKDQEALRDFIQALPEGARIHRRMQES